MANKFHTEEASESTICKIKKLLALANNAGATEGERDNALRMAHRLIAKYNLDLEDVEAHGAGEPRINHQNDTFGMKWCKVISNGVAKLFFCKYYQGRKINGTRMNHHFVGKTSNATTAALMAEFIITSILKEGRLRGWHNLSSEMRSFATGAADRVYARIEEMMKNPEVEGEATGTAMVVRDMYKTELDANMDFLSGTGVSLVAVKSRSVSVNMTQYNAGAAFGNGIGLNTQVSGGKSVKALR